MCVCTALRKLDWKGCLKEGKSRICWRHLPQAGPWSQGQMPELMVKAAAALGKTQSLSISLWGSLQNPPSLPSKMPSLLSGEVHTSFGDLQVTRW